MGERFYELREALETLIQARIKGGGPEVIKQINAIEHELNAIKRQKHLLNSDLGPVYCVDCGGFYKITARHRGFYTKANCEKCIEHEGLPFLGTRLGRLVNV